MELCALKQNIYIHLILLLLIITGCAPSINVDYQLGLQSYEKENYRTANAHFTRALWGDPTESEIYFYRTGAKYHLEDFPGAIDDYSRAIKCF